LRSRSGNSVGAVAARDHCRGLRASPRCRPSVNTLTSGILAVDSPILPIVPDAWAAAQGIHGAEGLAGNAFSSTFVTGQVGHHLFAQREIPRDSWTAVYASAKLWVVKRAHRRCTVKAIIDTRRADHIAILRWGRAESEQYAGRGKPTRSSGRPRTSGPASHTMPRDRNRLHPIRDSGVTFAECISSSSGNY